MRAFISYRRTDSAEVVGRIYEHLVNRFGNENVFKDVDSIPLGTDFREVIGTAIGRCSVLIVVIGPEWLGIVDKSMAPRIGDPNDYVRSEIDAALSQGKRIIPVLVRDAKMPTAEHLPASIQKLAFLNATVVRSDPDFVNDVGRLADAIGLWYVPVITTATMRSLMPCFSTACLSVNTAS